MPKALVLTVGVGRDVDRSLTLAIRQYGPDFVLFLCSPQSQTYADRVVREQSLPDGAYFIDVWEEAADVQQLVLHYEQVITDVLFRQRRFRPEEVFVDYTRGTKAMSAAVNYVAVALELGSISYIEGQRDERGQVITGTERFISFQPMELLFRRHWDGLVRLFNAGHFASVLAQIQGLRGRVVHPEHRSRLDFMERLAQACEAWEALDYASASRGFREALSGEFRAEAESLRLVDDLQRASDIVHAIWNRRCTRQGCGCGVLLDGPRVALDLLAHANRRAEEHRYDVAVALLYRLMEYIAQRRLHERGLRADDVRLESLPEAVRDKWASWVGIDKRLKVGMVQGYELLADLGDEVGRRFLECYRDETSRLRPYLESRNMSPLAHGFQPVGQKVFEGLRAIVVGSFLPELAGGWERLLPLHRLPQIPLS